MVIDFLETSGRLTIMFYDIVINLPTVFKNKKLYFDQAYEIGIRSLLLIISIAFFTGAVTAYQSGEQMVKLVPLNYLGLSVYKMMTMELGPVLTGIIMAGRYGSSVAAELGTMKVTEQIDALDSMAINPIMYLAVPRFLATMTMLPIAVIFADFIGIFGGYLISNLFFDLNFYDYFNEVNNHFSISDITMGLVKSIFFGLIISLIGCFVGFTTEGGAEGVGKATVKAFVISSVLILIADLVVAVTYLK
ncbi:MAG: ABC transporter permease [Candidatus Delongbacteria bacterium]|nr:ABC transporter permease [Candidatus Delongbacteria bacterium]MBN2833352.1 ABC transporter permease [Candidatus Delongbacteria bacterium]